MRYPKAVEETDGTVADEHGEADTSVLVFVGEDRDGDAAVKIETESDDHEAAIQATLSQSQVRELRDGLDALLE